MNRSVDGGIQSTNSASNKHLHVTLLISFDSDWFKDLMDRVSVASKLSSQPLWLPISRLPTGAAQGGTAQLAHDLRCGVTPWPPYHGSWSIARDQQLRRIGCGSCHYLGLRTISLHMHECIHTYVYRLELSLLGSGCQVIGTLAEERLVVVRRSHPIMDLANDYSLLNLP